MIAATSSATTLWSVFSGRYSYCERIPRPKMMPSYREIDQYVTDQFEDMNKVEATGGAVEAKVYREPIYIDGVEVGYWITCTEIRAHGGLRIIGARILEGDGRMRAVVRLREFKVHFEAFAQSQVFVMRPVLYPEGPIEDAIYYGRKSAGFSVERQVVRNKKRIDIVDHTNKMIIECKAKTSSAGSCATLAQIVRYGRLLPGYGLFLGLPSIDLPERVGLALRHYSIGVISAEEPCIAYQPDERGRLVADQIANLTDTPAMDRRHA